MDSANSSTSTDHDADRLFPPVVVLLTLLGVALRGMDAVRKSLWLDEFHSLFFARAESAAEVIERVKPDFHPPGYFLFLHLLSDFDGELLRWTSILVSTATLFPLLSLCRAGGMSGRARAAVAAVYAFAPYQVLYGAELRAYPFLQFVAVGLAWAALTSERSARTRFLVFAALTAIGLYLHYFTCVVVLAVGATRIFVSRPEWLRWRTVVLAGTVGVAAFLPWVLIDESWILSDPAVMFRPESQDTSTGEAAAHAWRIRGSDLVKALFLVPRMFVPMLDSLGELGGPVARVGSLAFAVTLVGCAPKLLGSLRDPEVRMSSTLRGALATCVVAYLIVLAFALYLWQRIPEQYFMACAWGWPVVTGVVVSRLGERAQGRVVAVIALAALVAGTGHALGRSREDFRTGVRVALDLGDGESTVFTGALSQPPWFSDLIPYGEYAPELECVEPLDVPKDAERVVILTRKSSIEVQQRKWEPIRMGREFQESFNVDGSVWVYVFVRP